MDNIIDLDGDVLEPPRVIVRCKADDCLHNVDNYCTTNISIDFNPNRGASTDATECENYNAIRA